MKIRCYSELKRLDTFEERFRYLELKGSVGETTFGHDRYLNQMLYTSSRWRSLRNRIIIRDNSCDLGIEGRDIFDKIFVHHMNPLSIEDIEEARDSVFDPEFLICVTFETHNAIHYGDGSLLFTFPQERRPGDTLLWSKTRRKEVGR